MTPKHTGSSRMTDAPHRCICGAAHLEQATAAPVDPRMPYPAGAVVSVGDVHRCLACGHVMVQADGDRGGWAGDAVAVVGRIDTFARWWAPHLQRRVPTALQIDAGLGRVASALAADGWSVQATDPDEDTVGFLRNDAGIAAERGGPGSLSHLGQFDLVLMVGALEYEPDPAWALRHAVRHIAPGGFLYLEVPDGDGPAAASSMPHGLRPAQRHAFTQTSVSVLVSQAGVSSLSVERVDDAGGTARFAVCCAVAEPARPDDHRRPMRQIAVDDPGGPAAAWAQIEDPTPADDDPDGEFQS